MFRCKVTFRTKFHRSQGPIPNRHLQSHYSTTPPSTIHNWSLISSTPIPDFKLQAYQYRHNPTNAKFLHLHAPHDDTNAFAIAFPTPPSNSTGVAHILEHATLCGSHKYPVRDLFFNMVKRSLNTYMNAWTASDCTSYPFATRNEADYYNLMGVYLDAVLRPRLSEEDFAQEGHRLEFEETEQMDSPLKIKGVVYNEMKGAMSASSSYFMHHLHQYTFPGTIYAHNSGGDPKEIPNLTYEQLKEFHRTHYHPSNAMVYTYGTFDFTKHLKQLDKAFRGFEPSQEVTIEHVKPLTEPQRLRITGPPEAMVRDGEENNQTKFAISYLTNPRLDTYETLCLSFLSGLLFDEPRGPFYKSLIESGLAPDFCGSGYDSSTKDTCFVVGVQNIAEDTIPKIEEAIQSTFQQVYDEGIEQSLIDSSLHMTELSIKKKSTNFGVNLAHGIISAWMHSGKPEESLFITENLERIKEELKAGTFFKRLIGKYFLNNPHRVALTMVPDEKHAENLAIIEDARVSKIAKTLTEEDKKAIVERGIKLKENQENKGDNTCLPSLTIKDISRPIPEPTEVSIEGNMMINEQSTNGISYVTFMVDIPENMPEHLIPYLPIFAEVLTRMGADGMNKNQLAEQIELYTGGISSDIAVIPSLNDIGPCQLRLKFSSLCLDRNIDRMVNLMRQIYTKPWLDSDLAFLKSILEQTAIGMSNGIVSSGHQFARLMASATLSRTDAYGELFGGLSSLEALNHILMEDNMDNVVNMLKEISQYVLTNNNVRVLLTSDSRTMPHFRDTVNNNFLAADLPSLPVDKLNAEPIAFQTQSRKVFVPIPAQVNFVSTCIQTVPFAHEDSALLSLASRLMSSNFLHTEVREKGGAYGCSSSYNHSGIFGYASYRDPHTKKTLSTYERVAQWIEKSNLTDTDMQEAKLDVFQGIDYPKTPHRKPSALFTFGITDELRQMRRETILDASLKDMKRVIGEHLGEAKADKHRSTVILGSLKDAPEFIREQQEGWIVHGDHELSPEEAEEMVGLGGEEDDVEGQQQPKEQV